MCGIAGIVNLTDRAAPPSREVLQSMIGALRHRGPDEFGIYRDARAGLAHARLSIIDLATGSQPMSDPAERYWIVFNGEIFNYIELRKELETLGHRFRTSSDTEVVLASFRQWGEDCFARFNGQWAIAIWDSQAKELILSRDRLGVRPLYLHEYAGTVRFASEVKALFADPAVPRRFDPMGLRQTFMYWAPVPPRTAFDGIEQLPAGSIRRYDRNGMKWDLAYWHPDFGRESRSITLAGAVEEGRSRLEHATALRILRADVPVGSYVSGGLDSSLVASLAARIAGDRLRTFSIRFTDSEYDETPYQRMLTEAIGSEHAELEVSAHDIAAAFPEVIAHTECPILRTAPVPLFLLSRLVRDSGVRCVLTGEGADEFFCGYDIFKEVKVREFWARDRGSNVRPRLLERLYPWLSRSPVAAKSMGFEFWAKDIEDVNSPAYSHRPRWENGRQLLRFFSEEVQRGQMEANIPLRLPDGFGSWDALSRAGYLEVMTFLGPYLLSSQGDRMLMAHSVEGRFPFLDVDLVEFSLRLPAHHRMAGLNEKALLKRIGRGLVPEEILNRTKQPYRAPDASSFFEGEVLEYVRHAFLGHEAGDSGVFDSRAMGHLYSKCEEKAKSPRGIGLGNSDNMAFMGVLSTQTLHTVLLKGGSGAATTLTLRTDVDRVLREATPALHSQS